MTKLRSPLAPGNEGQISEDGHSALIQFSPRGLLRRGRRRTSTRSRPATEKVQEANPGFYVGQAGSASTGKALDEMFELAARDGPGCSRSRSRSGSCCSCSARSSARRSRSCSRSPSVFATMGLVALPSQIVPMDESISEVILLIGLAVGVDYSLFYIRRERDERRAGRSESAALEAAAATSGRAVLISGHHGHDRDGRDVLLRRQDVHVVRDRDDDGRRRRDDRLAHRPARRCCRGSATGSTRCACRSSGGSSGRTASAGSGARSSTASSAGRCVSAVGATAVLVALALPALNLHTAISGLDALPAVADGGAVLQQGATTRSRAARPPRSSRSRATRPIPELQAAVADLRKRGARLGQGARPDRRRDVAERQGHSASRSRSSARARTRPRTRRSPRSATRSCRPRSARSRASSTR